LEHLPLDQYTGNSHSSSYVSFSIDVAFKSFYQFAKRPKLALFAPIDEAAANHLQTTGRPEAVTQRIQRPARLGIFSITTSTSIIRFSELPAVILHAHSDWPEFQLRHEAHTLVLEPWPAPALYL
jgi:hypothetical protein